MSDQRNLPKNPDRLIKVYDDYDTDSLTDYLLVMATDIEVALLQAGATPGEDYTYMQLFELAVQYKSP